MTKLLKSFILFIKSIFYTPDIIELIEDNEITEMYYGDKKITHIYLGDKLIRTFD